MAENIAIAVAAVSIMFNFFIVVIMVATGIGKEVVRKFFKKFTWRKPGYLPILYFGNNNVLNDKLVKTDSDGKFRFGGNIYSNNPRAKVDFDGLPHILIMEGVAEPIDLHKDHVNEKMSSKMLERIMLNAQGDDLLGTLKLYAIIAGIFIAITTVAVLANIYFNWQIFDVVVNGGTGSLISPN